MSNMLDILKNFDAAEKGEKADGPADTGSMKAILEGFHQVAAGEEIKESSAPVAECGDMPMEMPAMQSQGQPVTVSITASGKDNVDELMAILKGAGIEQHVDMPMAHDAEIEMPSKDQEMDMDAMRQIMAAGEKELPAPEQATDEEWDNAPDEEYGSEDDVLPAGDDMHRPKDRKAIRTNDPALESSIKDRLWAALAEKKMSKKKTDAEVDEAHGNDSMYDKCWDGYERVPGKKRGEKGSCRKK